MDGVLAEALERGYHEVFVKNGSALVLGLQAYSPYDDFTWENYWHETNSGDDAGPSGRGYRETRRMQQRLAMA